MAEWLGQHMSGWPGWLILIAMVVLAVVWVAYALTVYADADSLLMRHRNLKKREKEIRRAKEQETR